MVLLGGHVPRLHGRNDIKRMVRRKTTYGPFFLTSHLYYPNSVSLYGDSRVSGNTCFSPFL